MKLNKGLDERQSKLFKRTCAFPVRWLVWFVRYRAHPDGTNRYDVNDVFWWAEISWSQNNSSDRLAIIN